MAPKIYQVPPKGYKLRVGDSALCAPLFSGNHNNYCADGTSCFWKGQLFDGDWLILCFWCVSLCNVLYTMFITCFHKTSVNAEPWNPSILKKSPHITINVCFSFFIFVRLRLHFSICLYCCWISGTPCRPPGPDWLYFGSISVLFLVQLSQGPKQRIKPGTPRDNTSR